MPRLQNATNLVVLRCRDVSELTPPLADDEDLLSAAQADPAAFGEIFDRYYGPLLGYAVRRTGSVEVARDITSEVFLKALRGIHGFRWRGVSLSSWLHRISSNEIATWFRKRRYTTSSLEELKEIAGFDVPDDLDLQQELLDAESALQKHAEFLAVQQALLALPLRYQEPLALRFFQEKSVREVAEILNKKEGTVKSLLSRGTAMLRDEVQRRSQRPIDQEEHHGT